MRPLLSFLLLLSVLEVSRGAELKPATEQAFQAHVARVEQEFSDRITGRREFFWLYEGGSREVRVRREGVLVEPAAGKGDTSVRGGLVHDWIGAAFVPDATVTQVVKVVTGYDTHAVTYAPEVVEARILDHRGPSYRVFLRLKKKKVLTAVLDTEHLAEYRAIDNTHWFGISRSTSIREVENAGGDDESLKPVGRDSGFLWKLNVYWRFAQVRGGTLVECRAVSLSRDVPTGLGWVIRPIIRSLPRESLANSLAATRSAAMQ